MSHTGTLSNLVHNIIIFILLLFWLLARRKNFRRGFARIRAEPGGVRSDSGGTAAEGLPPSQ